MKKRSKLLRSLYIALAMTISLAFIMSGSGVAYAEPTEKVAETTVIDDPSDETEVDEEAVCEEEDDKSMGETLRDASLNTLMGMGIVILMLTLISFVISLFKYISVIQKKISDKKMSKDINPTEDAVIQQIVEKEEVCDDTELIAVITAAICASTGASSDSFVVRTIKKTRF